MEKEILEVSEKRELFDTYFLLEVYIPFIAITMAMTIMIMMMMTMTVIIIIIMMMMMMMMMIIIVRIVRSSCCW